VVGRGVCRQLTARAVAVYLRHWMRVSKNFQFKANFKIHNNMTADDDGDELTRQSHMLRVAVCFSNVELDGF